MRTLITGAQGQLGKDVVLHCTEAGDEVLGLSRAELDITDAVAVREAVHIAAPDTIINCAAWTAVDDCEADPDRANLVNANGVGFLVDAATAVGAHLVQVSTDYVFDGTKIGAYSESDQTNPQSAYGLSKLAGESAAGPDASVVRTSWVCSAHGGNMVETILRLAGNHPELSFVSDQRGNPTFTADLAPALRALAVDRHAGTIHITNSETVSWFEFAQAVLEATGQDPTRVSPIATSELMPPRPAPRPANSALSNDLFASLGYQPLRDFREALAEIAVAYS